MKTIFKNSDIKNFSLISHDANPLHIDELYARKTANGQRVVFGALGAMRCLEQLKVNKSFYISRLEIEFPNPIFIGVEYSFRLNEIDSEKTVVELCDGNKILVKVTVHFSNRQTVENRSIKNSRFANSKSPATKIRKKPRDYKETDFLNEIEVSGQYEINSQYIKGNKSAYPATSAPLLSSDVLMLCSYIVGMELPGKKALFSKLDLSFEDTGETTHPLLKYKAVKDHYDEEYGLLSIQLNVALSGRDVVKGELKSFVRKEIPEVKLPEIESLLKPSVSTLEGKIALVIGGSRGLGASIVRALALSGCNVLLNFTHSAKEAKEIENEFKGKKGTVTLLQGDAGDKEWRHKANKFILKKFKRLDLLICNACGPPESLSLTGQSSKRAKDYISRNLQLTTGPISAFVKTLKTNKGTIVGISSSIVETETEEWPEYRETKLKVEKAIQATAKKFKEISCVIARPPALVTDMSNTPIRLMNAIRPEIVGASIVNAVSGARNSGKIEILNKFDNKVEEVVHKKEIKPEKNREKIVLSATFTVEPVLESIEFWKNELKLPVDVEVAPYNQVFQELLSPGTLFSSNKMGMNTILFRFEDWLHEEIENVKSIKQKENYLRDRFIEFVDALESFTQHASCHILLLICPSFSSNKKLQNVFSSLEKELFDRLSALKGLDTLIMERYHESYGITTGICDLDRNELAHIPFTSKYFAAIGTTLIRRYYSLTHKAYKVIVVDCDNTLWGGVCGEVSPGELDIGGRFEKFQNFLIKQYEQGKILCLCSKNVESDVWNVFDRLKSMPLKREHIVDNRINWSAKSENIKSLAKSLNLGLDSFIFIDDNPIECAEVRANCPDALTIQWPENAHEVKQSLNHLWVFDCYAATEEDKKRSEMYKANIKRDSLMKSTSDFETFLKNLNLQVNINKFKEEDLTRVSQLTRRTNQFNFTTIRRTENQLRQLLFKDEGYECLTVKVTDKFGSYGLVGVVILNQTKKTLVLDSFMLSCRVLGRGVEHKIVEKIGKIAAKKGFDNVTVLFNETEKNLPARQFLEQTGILNKQHKAVGPQTNGANAPVSIQKFVTKARILYGIKHKANGLQPKGLAQILSKGASAPANKQKTLSEISASTREEQLAKIVTISNDIETLYKSVTHFHQQKPVSPGLVNAHSRQENVLHKNEALYNLQGRLLEEVKTLFGKTLLINPQEIKADENLELYVRDSFKIVELTVELRKEFGKLPATFLFEHRSIRAIVDNLMGTQRKELAAKYGISEDEANLTLGDLKRHDISIKLPTGNELGRDCDIAIVGMEGKFPQAETLLEFWENLVQGKDCITEIPRGRWDVDNFFDPTPQPGKSYSKWGGFLEDIDRFDASLFCISPTEAELMDPQQRLLLEVVWGLLENAGYTRKSIARKTGVFIGVNANDYINYTNETALAGLSSYRYSDYYQLSNRISYFFDFKGPSITLDTACSSSGTSLHLACKSLMDRDCETAIIGGVNMFLHPSRFVQYSQMQMLSSDNKCRPFGDGATGTVFGEGVGALLLKPLPVAEQDNDHIYGVIKGSSINSGGKTNGFTVPNPQAHAELVSKALTQANVDPRTISYLEAHGTGTPLGDPIEIRGLQMAFSANTSEQYRDDKQYCALGAIKANIGHLEAAAGLAAMIKVLLQMQHKTLVPSLYSKKTNREIPFKESQFYVQQETTEWKRPVLEIDGKSIEIPRRAGISTFGAGGSNAHVVIEEYEMPVTKKNNHSQCIIAISALEDEQLKMYAARLSKFLMTGLSNKTDKAELNLSDIAYTLQVGREVMEKRLAFVVSNVKELTKKLLDYSRGAEDIKDCFSSTRFDNDALNPGAIDDKSIMKIIGQKDLAQIARIWVSGKDIDWSTIYTPPLPRRIPLPSYPFAGDRYWVPKMTNLKSGKLHPLIDSIEPGLSLNSGIVFKKRFKNNDLILKDHQVQNQPVLPGVGYLAAAYAAASQTIDINKYCLKKMVWQKPLVVENGEMDILIAINKQDEDIHFEIKSNGDSDVITFATGRFSLKELSPSPVNQQVSIDDVKSRCASRFDKKTIYNRFKKRGFSYGPYFQGLSQVWFNDKEALGQINLPSIFEDELNQFDLQPTLADAAFQTSLHLFPDAKNPMLPFSVEKVELLRQLPMDGYAYVKRNGNHLFVVDILDEKGNLCVRFHDLALRELKDQMQCFFYAPTWKESPLTIEPIDPLNPEPLNPSTTLLIYSPHSVKIKDALSKVLDRDNLIELKLGTETKQISSMSWEAKVDDPFAIDNCIGSLKNIDSIYFMGSVHSSPEDSENIDLVQKTHYGILSLFRLIKSLDKHGFTKLPLQLKVIANNVFSLTEKEITMPWSSGVFSLSKSISNEYSQVKVASIDIDLDEIEKGFSRNSGVGVGPIVRETASQKSEPVVFRNGLRYVRTADAITLPPAEKPVFRNKGVYLIVGGAGGLGFELSCFLAKTVQARLIWIGRRAAGPQQNGASAPLGEEKTALKKQSFVSLQSGKQDNQINKKITQIKELKGDAIYIMADASDHESMDRAIDKAKSKFGTINGAVHSAVALHDKTLGKMDEQDFKAALKPKVEAAVVLSNLLKDEPMDFMLFFSSINSFTSAMGQANYSAGCCFSDAFAHYLNNRSEFPVKVINWGYWGGVGLASTEEDNRRMRALGHYSIDPKQGMEAVMRIMADAREQVIAVKADNSILTDIGVQGLMVQDSADQSSAAQGFNGSGVEDSTDYETSGTDRQGEDISSEELFDKSVDYVKTVFAKTLKIKKPKIDISSTFERYGIDSLISLQIIQEFEKDTGSLSPTLLFENITIKELAEFFCNSHTKTMEKMFGVERTKSVVVEKTCETDLKETARAEQRGENDFIPSEHSLNKTGDCNEHKFANQRYTDDIAIIGLSGKYPRSDTPDEFWKNIHDGINCISEIPKERWDRNLYYDPVANNESGKFHSKWGGFINDVDKFDPLFFNIAPIDAEKMDPQQRLFLETAWKTIEDAGYTRNKLTEIQDRHNKGIGLYVGCMYHQYPFVTNDVQTNSELSPFSYWYIANRVSFFLNLRGPSLAIDSACSSSLTAIHLACESLKNGESLMAIAGGVNLNLHPSKFALLNQMGILASTDHNRSLGDGDGYIPGEGVGAVLLKPLSMAVQDKDHIYAVIKSTAINHGGKTSGLTVPNPKELGKLFTVALEKSNINPRAVNYVEVAANGSPMGDPIEIAALNNAFRSFTNDKNYCALGAVKSNIGHLEAASGVSQLTKVLYQLKHKLLAPSLNAEPLNPKINLKDSCFYVQKELAEWKRPTITRDGRLVEYPRTAAITAIGAGGSNAHLIVEEYEQPVRNGPETQDQQCDRLVTLSAKNSKRLKDYAVELLSFLKNEGTSGTPNEFDENKLLAAIQKDLLHDIAILLEVNENDIGTNQEFIDYGCDEIFLTDLSQRINNKYSLDIILDDLVENSTIENCAHYLLENNREALATYHADNKKRAMESESKTGMNLISIDDIAYTFQVGREAMNERLAIVVSNKEELMEKLEQYSMGLSHDSLVQGNVSNNASLSKMMSDSKEGNDFVKNVINRGSLIEIAQLWVSGIQIDWELLYSDESRPMRKPLPTYPFARDSHWVKPPSRTKQFEQNVFVNERYGPETPQTPVMHEQDTSSLPVTNEYNTGSTLLGELKDDLKKCIAGLLKVDEMELETDTDLQEYGFDSINLASFVSVINEKYEIELTVDLFLAYPTISSCATFLLKNYHDLFADHYRINEQDPQYSSKREINKPQPKSSPNEPVAIIGVSGMMPQSDDLNDFWENLESGRNLITEMPDERWDWEDYYKKPQFKSNIKDLLWGGFLNNIDKFDNLFFALSPREAELMDPQQRIFLQTVWQTIENAGYAVSDLAGTNTGLFVGVSCFDYEQALQKLNVKIEAHTSTSLMVHSILANRLSYMLDFHGPSEIVDTACSSSTVAVHRAIRAIQSGDCNLTIAGGVNVLLDPQGFMTLKEAGILSSTPEIKLFHNDGEGYLRGEGVGAVLLKPLSKAVEDRDHIYAVIKGSDVNHDGKSFSLTSPNPVAQTKVVRNAYTNAGIDPSTVSYIEAQGTGSPIGDPVEIKAFINAFKELYEERGMVQNSSPHCGIGYLKPSIGHLESAYGISAIIKVILAMEKNKLPATRNINEEVSSNLLKGSPFYMVTENKTWEQTSDQQGNLVPRRAGVHSFGVGGVNAHIVLEEHLEI